MLEQAEILVKTLEKLPEGSSFEMKVIFIESKLKELFKEEDILLELLKKTPCAPSIH